MASRSKSAQLSALLDRLEKAYGPLVPTEDPVEAGLMALLAEHAPDLSRVQTRQALREWVVDWNEMRVADPWDISNAIAPGGHAGARAFARAALRLLAAVQEVANRVAFDRALADPEVDVDVLVDKMRNVPEHARAVMKTVLSEDGDWKPDKTIGKLVLTQGLVPKTTSLAKIAKGLASIAAEDDRVRAHYLLGRYAHRPADAPDPLDAPVKATRKPAKKAAAKKPAKKAASKTAAKKTAKKAAKNPAKKAAKKTAKKPAKKTSKR
jgi:hypothetical protein